MTSAPEQPETWREFERLAAQIYTELVPQGAQVKHDDSITGRLSGIPRQIDVSIRYEIAGHTLLTIVQAKDYATPADVNTVGEFAAVVQDVRASKGVLICRSGFTQAARTLAAAVGIDLCNVHDASSKKWSLQIQIPILWLDLHPNLSFEGGVHLEAGDSLPASFSEWVLSADGGKSRVLPFQTFQRLWNSGEISRIVGPTHNLETGDTRFQLLVRDANGKRAWREFVFQLTYTVEQHAWLGSFTPSECRGILHYEDGRFFGRFPIGAVPIERDETWVPVEDPERLVVSTPGTLVTSESYTILTGKPITDGLIVRLEESGDVLEPEQTDSDNI